VHVSAGSKVRHADIDAAPRDPTSPTTSNTGLNHGLRNDAHCRHHQPPPARRRSSPLAPIQPTAARGPCAAPAPAAFDGSATSSDYDQSPKVITIVDGTGVPRPRPNVKFLLNLQSFQTYEQFVRDVACALDKGTASMLIDSEEPRVRLFTVRGREVADISDLFRDDDVFIGVGVGRNELSVSEVRQIFEELYPNSAYSETLVRKWMRTRRRNGRPRHSKHPVESEIRQKLGETRADRMTPEGESTVDVETESVEEPVMAAESRLEDTKTLEDNGSRLHHSEPRLSQSVAKQTRLQQRRRGGSVPRRGKPLLPPLMMPSSQQIRDKNTDKTDESSVRQSKPRQRGRRLIRLAPLRNASATDAEPSHKSCTDAATSPVEETKSSRRDESKATPHRSRASNGRTSRSKPAGQSANDDVKRRGSSALETDENGNIVADVPQLGNETGQSKDGVTETTSSNNQISSRSGKEERKENPPRPYHVKMKTKFERQVSTVEHVKSSYEEGKVLGDGNFAVVKQCRHRESGREYAMKVRVFFV